MSTWFVTYGYAQVQPDLFIGAYPTDAGDVSELAALEVDRVLNLVQDAEYRAGERAAVEQAYTEHGIDESRLTLVDFGDLPAAQIDAAVELVLDWLDEDHRVYLHCRAGWQRSAAIAAGVIALSEHLTIEDALDALRNRKATADPLPHQRTDLINWWLDRR